MNDSYPYCLDAIAETHARVMVSFVISLGVMVSITSSAQTCDEHGNM